MKCAILEKCRYTGRQTVFLRVFVNKPYHLSSYIRPLSYLWVISMQQSPLLCVKNNAEKNPWHCIPSKLLLLLLLWHPKEYSVLHEVVKKTNYVPHRASAQWNSRAAWGGKTGGGGVTRGSIQVTGISSNSYWYGEREFQCTLPILTPCAQRNPWDGMFVIMLSHSTFISKSNVCLHGNLYLILLRFCSPKVDVFENRVISKINMTIKDLQFSK